MSTIAASTATPLRLGEARDGTDYVTGHQQFQAEEDGPAQLLAKTPVDITLAPGEPDGAGRETDRRVGHDDHNPRGRSGPKVLGGVSTTAWPDKGSGRPGRCRPRAGTAPQEALGGAEPSEAKGIGNPDLLAANQSGHGGQRPAPPAPAGVPSGRAPR